MVFADWNGGTPGGWGNQVASNVWIGGILYSCDRTALVLRLPAGTLLACALVNPLQVFKVAAVLALQGGLDALGPAGLYATTLLPEGLLPLLAGILLLWTVLPLLVTGWTLRRRGGLP